MAKDPVRGSDAVEPQKSREPAGESAVYREDVGAFTALRNGNFRLLLTVHMFGVAAQWIQQLTINWLVYNLTGSGTILGALNMVGTFT